jgi:polysaccharide pyruvyl transferase WcaK-like protein
MSVMQNLARRLPAVEFVGITPDPADTFSTLKIPAFPLHARGDCSGFLSTAIPATGVSWLRMHRLLDSVDLLIVSGGGQLDDFWGGPWDHPWAMFKWTWMSRILKTPVVFLGVGVDKLDSIVSRKLCTWALNGANARWFRDLRSRQFMAALGVTSSASVCPDLAFALDHVPAKAAVSPEFVVLSPISRKTWSHSPTSYQHRYLDSLVRIAKLLATKGFAIRIVCSQSRMDEPDARQLLDGLHEAGIADAQHRLALSVDDYLSNVSGARLVIASRLHACILALVAGCPVVALGHLDKVKAAMEAVELSAYFLPLHDFTDEALVRCVEDALFAGKTIRSDVISAREAMRAELEAVFDRVSALVL